MEDEKKNNIFKTLVLKEEKKKKNEANIFRTIEPYKAILISEYYTLEIHVFQLFVLVTFIMAAFSPIKFS